MSKKGGLMKPELKYENGKLVAKAAVGVDTDKDGQNAIGAEVVVYVDAKEAVAEIIKSGAPDWLKAMLPAEQ